MYEAVTRGIRVRVTPKYLEEESSPDEGRFFWAYTIDISNEGSETVQLCSRHWRITDSEGRNEEVRGPGVIGQMPILKPGESFRLLDPKDLYGKAVLEGKCEGASIAVPMTADFAAFVLVKK